MENKETNKTAEDFIIEQYSLPEMNLTEANIVKAMHQFSASQTQDLIKSSIEKDAEILKLKRELVNSEHWLSRMINESGFDDLGGHVGALVGRINSLTK